ncbi:acyl-CoA dehydrogenase [Halomonas urumqiensis]|nr:acyl-CoA dehydrogenase [Halomonas urumqiensis]
MFRQAYRRFLAAEVVPHMARFREQGVVDREVYRKAGEQGFLMVWPDECYGGMGDRDIRFEQVIIEEIARADVFEFFAPLHSRLVGPYLDTFGNAEQKQRWLPGCVSGETILAVAMTEPDAGSDLAGMRTHARDMGDHYLLNGAKTYISNGLLADLVVVAAKTDPENNPHAMALMVVERGMPGFERGKKLDKMGLAAQDTAELFFHDVKVPKANVLGDPSKGFHYLMHGLAEERLLAAFQNVGMARKAFDITRTFVMERRVFGKPLSAQQNTQFQMAAIEAELDMAQVYVDQCATWLNEGQLSSARAARAKLLSSEALWRMLDLGVQLHGGTGYMMESPICRMFVDGRVARILAGSSEIMKLIIAREIFADDYPSLLD